MALVNGIIQIGIGFSSFLEREAGRLLIAYSLILLGMFCVSPESRSDLAKQVVSFALGCLTTAMGTRKAGGVQ